MQSKKAPKVKITSGIQEQFVQRLRTMLPPGIGLAEEIAGILGVSVDSAYRRLRGETELTIDEIFRITRKYPVSIDQVFGARGEHVTFSYTKLTNSAENFRQYLKRLTGHLRAINQFPNRRIYYVAEEMPLFYSFYSKIFAEFKLFYWQRSVLNCPEYQQKEFTHGIIPQELVEIAHQAYNEYLTIPGVEVWTDLTVLTGLRQIGFYYDTGVLSREISLELLNEYRNTIAFVQRNAEDARKSPGDTEETFALYSSDLVLGTNCIYAVTGETAHSYISFNTLNSLSTDNPEFTEETENWMRNLEKKSTLISGVASKQRYQFFNSMFRKIDEQIERVKNSG
jgi:hypothetical protein